MIGVSVSTLNRREIAQETITQWVKRLPNNTPLVIVDDGSDEPFPLTPGAVLVRHEKTRGVAAAKNTGIATLMDLGCDHIFLSDDDCYPIVDDWWQPYVNSPEKHLMYNWPHPRPFGSRAKWRIIHRDAEHFSIGFPRGVMLYMDRECIDAIGGFDEHYGRGEHVDYSYRAWLAGMSSFTQSVNGVVEAAYGDVNGSRKLWYALDEHKHIESTFGSWADMRRLDAEGGQHWGRNFPDNKPVYIDPWTGERK